MKHLAMVRRQKFGSSWLFFWKKSGLWHTTPKWQIQQITQTPDDHWNFDTLQGSLLGEWENLENCITDPHWPHTALSTSLSHNEESTSDEDLQMQPEGWEHSGVWVNLWLCQGLCLCFWRCCTYVPMYLCAFVESSKTVGDWWTSWRVGVCERAS